MKSIPVFLGSEIVQATTFDELPLSSGTSLQSGVIVKYADLVRLFGEPNTEGDTYKTDAEWIVMTGDGVCTIYNYKDGKNYCGDEGLSVEDITEWHLGGHNKYAPECIKQYILRNV